MTNSPYSDPNSSRNNDLGFDEFIAILVAFATIGAIMWWSFSRKDSGWEITGVSSPTPTPTASTPPIFTLPTPTAETTVKPETEADSQATAVEPKATPSPSAKIFPDVFSSGVSKSTPQVQTVIPAAVPFMGNAIKKPAITQAFPEITQPSPVVTPSETKSPIPPPLAFNDVDSSFWGHRFIKALSSKGIVRGYKDYTFRPNQPVNRAAFAAILQQAFKNTQATKLPIEFKDIPPKFWADSAIKEAIVMGFLKGYPDNNFKPDQRIPRVQVLVALVSGLNLAVPPNPNQVLSIYKDAQDIPKYATDKIAAATVNGLVVSSDPQFFEPNKDATRAEVTAMVHQALVRMGRLEPINSKNIVRTPENSPSN
ncbi:MAG: S-layer homology domain-containing protein [Nostocaceae cyanobacterium]|nr:S-layer homology domain-containing protein [Nostocaceae cyanobacterium]